MQSSTTTKRLTTTTNTISPGRDCNEFLVPEVAKQITLASDSQGSTDSALFKLMNSLADFRSYIRRLDLPILTREQTNLVNVTEGFINSINRYLESGRTDLSVNDKKLEFRDALEDFLYAATREC